MESLDSSSNRSNGASQDDHVMMCQKTIHVSPKKCTQGADHEPLNESCIPATQEQPLDTNSKSLRLRGWYLFQQQAYAQVKQDHPDLSPKSRKRIVSARYQSLSKSEKQVYIEEALKEEDLLARTNRKRTANMTKKKERQDYPQKECFMPIFETELIPTVPLFSELNDTNDEPNEDDGISGLLHKRMQSEQNVPASKHPKTLSRRALSLGPSPVLESSSSLASLREMSVQLAPPRTTTNAAQDVYDDISKIGSLQKSPSTLLSDFLEATLFAHRQGEPKWTPTRQTRVIPEDDPENDEAACVP